MSDIERIKILEAKAREDEKRIEALQRRPAPPTPVWARALTKVILGGW